MHNTLPIGIHIDGVLDHDGLPDPTRAHTSMKMTPPSTFAG